MVILRKTLLTSFLRTFLFLSIIGLSRQLRWKLFGFDFRTIFQFQIILKSRPNVAETFTVQKNRLELLFPSKLHKKPYDTQKQNISQLFFKTLANNVPCI